MNSIRSKTTRRQESAEDKLPAGAGVLIALCLGGFMWLGAFALYW